MCLVLFAYRLDARFPLVIAANRDEFFARPTAPMDFWPGHPDLLGGQDLEHGGMWFGVTRSGRLALVTNVRHTEAPKGPRSRGALVRDFLLHSISAEEFLTELAPQAREYPGFNLLLGTPGQLVYHTNSNGCIHALRPGLYGLSNAALDSPWYKVEQGKKRLREALAAPGRGVEERLFSLLADRCPAPDAQLPDTGYGLEWERLLSPAFIRSPAYGTRSSTVLRLDRLGAAVLTERTFDDRGNVCREVSFRLDWRGWVPFSGSSGNPNDPTPGSS